MSENFSPVTAEAAQTGEDTDNSKSKKKKKAIGAFVVEADPNDTASSFWRRPKSPSKETKPSLLNPEVDVEADTLSESEKTDAIKQLAAARKLELSASEFESTDSPEETDAALAYLSAVESAGDIDSSESVNTAELDMSELDHKVLDENVIDTEHLSEGEIFLNNESAEPDSPVESLVDSGQGNLPPNDPNLYPDEPDQPDEPDRPTNSHVIPTPVTIAQTAGNTIPLNLALQNERRAKTDGLVVGAVVGYFIGRRRGRIKTEKKLIPVQKKLEKQVKTLQNELLTREYQVRQSVRERIVKAPAEQIVSKNHIGQEKRLRTTINPGSTERIGHVLVAASSTIEKSSSNKQKKPPKLESITARKRSESMDRAELLSISQTIVVEGTSLRQIYETQLISEKGLRRLIAEHLRGGNISRALKRELVERQIDFERDPLLRDKSYKSNANRAGKAALAGMQSSIDESSSKRTVLDESKVKSSSQKAKLVQKTGPQALIDVSLAALIGFLILVILTLLFRS